MIPNLAHFIWYGAELAWLHEMAIRSAARSGGFSKIVLHHEPCLSAAARLRLTRIPRLELRVISPEPTFRLLDGGSELLALYSRLSTPAARANVLRAALLYLEGGVYLDADTVTLESFEPLRAAAVFCGAERIALPADRKQRGSAVRAYSLMLLRDLLRRVPEGPSWFRHVEHLYPLAANNAVLGAERLHPFMRSLLDAMLELPEPQQLRRYALGTHLLQNVLRSPAGSAVTVHDPEVFYPLAPEISEHWFRLRKRVDLGAVLSSNTRLVHWYASVRTRAWVERMDEAYVRSHQRQQLLSALLAAQLDDATLPLGAHSLSL
jgi:hypothetical protein